MSSERETGSPVTVAERHASQDSPASADSESNLQIEERSGESSGTAILLAWVVSLLGHVLLFVAMFAIPWLTGMVKLPEDLPIPRTDLAPVQPHVEISREPEFTNAADSAMEELVMMEPQRFELMSDRPTAEHTDLAILGVGTGGGDLSRIGLGGGAAQTGPTFFGLGGKAREARRIVYVVDCSGSMLELMESVKAELKRSLKGLRRSQRFHVIFYNDGPPIENPPKKLIIATAVNKEAAFGFIDRNVQAGGGTDPIPAVRRAFSVKPDLVYFLSDGEIPMGDDLVRLINEDLNADQAARVFTIAFVNPAGAELLEKIARANRGEFRYVSEHDLFQ
ncbi:MAG: VWA domain-containing protein [Phycisphaerae bacterium]|nr:VWA domain-containing protein [Phycisphaerae bacterium]